MSFVFSCLFHEKPDKGLNKEGVQVLGMRESTPRAPGRRRWACEPAWGGGATGVRRGDRRSEEEPQQK